ncbi:MAG: aminopeptidase [Acidobacteriota bacterium]
MDDASLDRYARLLVEHAAGLRDGQALYIFGEIAHRDLALRIAEIGYDAGAGHVSTFLQDPRQLAQLVRRGRLERIELAHESERAWLHQALTDRAAMVSLRGEEDPRLMPQVAREQPDRHAVFTRSATARGRVYTNHAVNRSLCPWVVAGVPTPGWARLVFPDLEEAEALERLWDHVLAFTGADRDDFLEVARAKDRHLHARRRALDELAIRAVRIVGGGSDLRVALSSASRWLGGSKDTVDGQRFLANVPTEENFTTPDRRGTEGRLVATMPFRTRSGLLVEGLIMDFEAGRLSRFEATRGAEGFRRWIDSDEGARYLGELALVGSDSPIARSGLFFEHTLYDENAWPHVALGQAYTTGLIGGDTMSAATLAKHGCNVSAIHTDIMVGSTEVSVIATETREGEVPLIRDGRWVDRFLAPPTEAPDASS